MLKVFFIGNILSICLSNSFFLSWIIHLKNPMLDKQLNKFVLYSENIHCVLFTAPTKIWTPLTAFSTLERLQEISLLIKHNLSRSRSVDTKYIYTNVCANLPVISKIKINRLKVFEKCVKKKKCLPPNKNNKIDP